MKYLSIFLLALVGLSSCKKDRDINTEPLLPKVISKDSIKTGQYWGMAIGDTHAQTYAKLAEMKAAKKIVSIGVVGNVFTTLDSLSTRIPLYRAIYLDETTGTADGVQIGFANDKVVDIYYNNGVRVNAWPSTGAANATVMVGDSSKNLYQKFVNIKQISAYSKKFERISLFYKDINKAYDPYTGNSPQWYVVSPEGTNRYYELLLNFKEGKLAVIHTTLYEQQ
ncbi:hypothetical protein [Mucilaginibacter myungsuensis]|uniref:Lipoprotein n=1 Tax=Mucilaginibacter myungsuensis TaxID=649104 RepID=A0A929L2Y2_9SPHI|nr:hypothetical protein [Mucilaginibacter myungsuensis]MBE9663494.1 hypothetical protein [Mucilaginibacter myungsuensis]MDN3600232.1 hypothetical protein [Mucilaginibacter myungsuensis]